MPTTSGQSGSPILVFKEEKYFAIGIHSGFRNQEKLNSAKLISEKVIDGIWRWEREM